jgi:hypothetical protein
LTPHFTIAAGHDVARAVVQGVVAVFRPANVTLLAVHALNATRAVCQAACNHVPEAVPAIDAHALVFVKALGRNLRAALERVATVAAGTETASDEGFRTAVPSLVDELLGADNCQVVLVGAGAFLHARPATSAIACRFAAPNEWRQSERADAQKSN